MEFGWSWWKCILSSGNSNHDSRESNVTSENSRIGYAIHDSIYHWPFQTNWWFLERQVSELHANSNITHEPATGSHLVSSTSVSEEAAPLVAPADEPTQDWCVMNSSYNFLCFWERLQVRGVRNDSMDQEYPNCKLYKTLALVLPWLNRKEPVIHAFKRILRVYFVPSINNSNRIEGCF